MKNLGTKERIKTTSDKVIMTVLLRYSRFIIHPTTSGNTKKVAKARRRVKVENVMNYRKKRKVAKVERVRKLVRMKHATRKWFGAAVMKP